MAITVAGPGWEDLMRKRRRQRQSSSSSFPIKRQSQPPTFLFPSYFDVFLTMVTPGGRTLFHSPVSFYSFSSPSSPLKRSKSVKELIRLVEAHGSFQESSGRVHSQPCVFRSLPQPEPLYHKPYIGLRSFPSSPTLRPESITSSHDLTLRLWSSASVTESVETISLNEVTEDPYTAPDEYCSDSDDQTIQGYDPYQSIASTDANIDDPREIYTNISRYRSLSPLLETSREEVLDSEPASLTPPSEESIVKIETEHPVEESLGKCINRKVFRL